MDKCVAYECVKDNSGWAEGEGGWGQEKKKNNNKKTGGEGHSKCNTEVIDSFSHVIILRVPVVVCRNTG